MTTAVSPQAASAQAVVSAEKSRRLLRRRVARAEGGPLCRHDQSRHGTVARQGRRFRGRRHRCGGRRGKDGVRRMAARAAARARENPATDRGNPAPERQRARDDRCRRLRQSGQGNGQRRDDRRRADGILRRLCHRDEGRFDSDGSGRGQLLRPRTAGRGRPHHSVQSSVHVLRRQVGGSARRRQYGGGEAAGAGAAVLAAAGRTDRRPAAAGRRSTSCRAGARPGKARQPSRTSP